MASPARRFALACAVGATIPLAIFFWFLSTSSAGFFGRTPFRLGGFYDAQARALFHGHWNAPGNAFFIERFTRDGKYYTYFGPWPALLRMPLLLVTSRLDGELTRASLLLASVTLFAAVGLVLWQVRALRGDDAPATRREQLGVIGFMVLVGCGSSVVFLTASGWVYDEAILWGAAWAVLSLHFAIAYLRSPTRTTLILTVAASTLAILSRVSSGAVGVAVLGSFFVVQLLRAGSRSRIRNLGLRLATLTGIDDRLDGERAWPLGLAAATPLVAYAAVNWAKFRVLYNVPFDKQDLILRSVPNRRSVLAQNGNSLVSFRELPTNVVHYLRPDTLSIHGLFPFIDFGRSPTVIGNVVREPEGLTASLTATTTLLLVLAVAGLAIVFVPKLARRSNLQGMRVLRLPTLAALISFVPTLIFPAVAERYKVDLTPALVLAGGAGMYAVAALVRGSAGRRRLLGCAAAIVMAFNVGTNLALTLNFERGYQKLDTAANRGIYVREQISWTKRLGFTPNADVIAWNSRSTRKRPAVGPVGSFLAINDCAQLMLSNGQDWLALDLDNPRATCKELRR